MITITITIHETEFDLEANIDSIQPAEPNVGIMSTYVEGYSLHWADLTEIPQCIYGFITNEQDEKIRKILNQNHDDYYGEAYNN